MKFRCKMEDIMSIQMFYKMFLTVSKLTDQNCIIRITPNRFYIFSKFSVMTGEWFISAEVRPDMILEEFQMSGYSVDANEIYLEIKADTITQSLKIPSQFAKFVKIKLTNKGGPCMAIEAELPSQAPNCRRTLYEAPIKIVHRQLWTELTPKEDLMFNTSCNLPLFKVFKGVIDRMRSLGHEVEISLNREGELRLHVGDTAAGYIVDTVFENLEISPEASAAWDVDHTNEEEEEVISSNGFFKVTVDIRQLCAFFGAFQFPTSRVRCDIRNRNSLLLTYGADNLRMRCFIPSIDSNT